MSSPAKLEPEKWSLSLNQALSIELFLKLGFSSIVVYFEPKIGPGLLSSSPGSFYLHEKSDSWQRTIGLDINPKCLRNDEKEKKVVFETT